MIAGITSVLDIFGTRIHAEDKTTLPQESVTNPRQALLKTKLFRSEEQDKWRAMPLDGVNDVIKERLKPLLDQKQGDITISTDGVWLDDIIAKVVILYETLKATPAAREDFARLGIDQFILEHQISKLSEQVAEQQKQIDQQKKPINTQQQQSAGPQLQTGTPQQRPDDVVTLCYGIGIGLMLSVLCITIWWFWIRPRPSPAVSKDDATEVTDDAVLSSTSGDSNSNRLGAITFKTKKEEQLIATTSITGKGKKTEQEALKVSELSNSLKDAREKEESFSQTIADIVRIGRIEIERDESGKVRLPDVVNAVSNIVTKEAYWSEQAEMRGRELEASKNELQSIEASLRAIKTENSRLKTDNLKLKETQAALDTLRIRHDELSNEVSAKVERLRVEKENLEKRSADLLKKEAAYEMAEVSLTSRANDFEAGKNDVESQRDKAIGEANSTRDELVGAKGHISELKREKAELESKYAELDREFTKETATSKSQARELGDRENSLREIGEKLKRVSSELNAELKKERDTRQSLELSLQISRGLLLTVTAEREAAQTKYQVEVQKSSHLASDLEATRQDVKAKAEQIAGFQTLVDELSANQLPTGILPGFFATEDFGERSRTLMAAAGRNRDGIPARRVLGSLVAMEAELAAGPPTEKQEDFLRQVLPALGRHLYGWYETTMNDSQIVHREMELWAKHINEGCRERGFCVTPYRVGAPPDPRLMEMIGNGSSIKKVFSWLVVQNGAKVKGAVVHV